MKLEVEYKRCVCLREKEKEKERGKQNYEEKQDHKQHLI